MSRCEILTFVPDDLNHPLPVMRTLNPAHHFDRLGRKVQASSMTPLTDFISQLFTDLRDVAQVIAPLAAVIGFIGLGVMYMSSSWPIIGDWKKDNPKAASQVVMGLVFVVVAASAAALISFA